METTGVGVAGAERGGCDADRVRGEEQPANLRRCVDRGAGVVDHPRARTEHDVSYRRGRARYGGGRNDSRYSLGIQHARMDAGVLRAQGVDGRGHLLAAISDANPCCNILGRCAEPDFAHPTTATVAFDYKHSLPLLAGVVAVSIAGVGGALRRGQDSAWVVAVGSLVTVAAFTMLLSTGSAASLDLSRHYRLIGYLWLPLLVAAVRSSPRIVAVILIAALVIPGAYGLASFASNWRRQYRTARESFGCAAGGSSTDVGSPCSRLDDPRSGTAGRNTRGHYFA